MIPRLHIGNPCADPLRRLFPSLLLVGPGIFCVGYSIGTGAVTKLAVAGAQSGLQMLWALLLGGLLFGVLLEACGRYALVTGESIVYGFRTRLRGGRWLALALLGGVVIAQWTGLPVLIRLVAQLVAHGLHAFMPQVSPQSPCAILGIAAIMLGGVYALVLFCRYSVWEKVMMALVALMLGGFMGAMWLVSPGPAGLAPGLVPLWPEAGGGVMPGLPLVGTALAAPTFLARALVLQGKGWGDGNMREQRRDAAISAAVVFMISAAVMAGAAGALSRQGASIRSLIDVSQGFDQAGGRLAAGLFLLGTIGAGLSSIIPMVMILPLLMADYGTGRMEVRTSRFRGLAALACAAGLMGPVLGDQLLSMHRIAGQVAQVFVLPLVVGGIILLLNRDGLMSGQKAGGWLNAGLLAAFGISLMLSWSSLVWLGKEVCRCAP